MTGAKRLLGRLGRSSLGLLVALTVAASPLRGETVVQWDLNGDLNATTAHPPLSVGAAHPAIAPSVTFEDADTPGGTAQVAHFSRGTYFRARPGLSPNGGGIYLNEYTIILDVMFPDRSPSGGWAALFQTNVDNANDGEWFVNPANGIGISGSYQGYVLAGEWHRLALVADLAAGTLTNYVDGARLQDIAVDGTDGRFSVYTKDDGARDGFLLFADENGENAEGYVDAIQVRDAALCPEEVASLGSYSEKRLVPDPVPPDVCKPPPPPALAIKEGPYLQWATLSEITVMWETSITARGSLFFRRQGGEFQEAVGPPAVKIHEVRAGGFTPYETVEYFVRSEAGDVTVESDPSTFRTNPGEVVPFSFTIFGDNHVNPPVFAGLVNRMVTNAPDLAMSCGDVVNTGGIYAEWGQGFLSPLRPLARSVPFYVAIGNHEQNAHWFYDYVAQPGNEHWFSFDYSGCHFVIIDTNFPIAPRTPQYRWIEEDLFSEAAQKARWLFAFHHHPPYSEIVEETIYAQVRMHLVPLFEAAGVDMDFTGHIHDYERGIYTPPDTQRRIAYIQTSGAGGQLWDDEFAGTWEQIQKVIQYVYHYCLVEISGDTLSFKAIALDGRVIDSFTLKELPRGEEPVSDPSFRRGDANADGQYDVSDAVFTLLHLFTGEKEASCEKTMDSNDDGRVDISDAIRFLGYLFHGQAALPAPLSSCAPDPTPDGLGCVSYPPCP
jgi:Calcineurin-like phosphoesterase